MKKLIKDTLNIYKVLHRGCNISLYNAISVNPNSSLAGETLNSLNDLESFFQGNMFHFAQATEEASFVRIYQFNRILNSHSHMHQIQGTSKNVPLCVGLLWDQCTEGSM